MKIKITEAQYSELIKTNLDEDYPIGWNVEEFKNLKSFAKRVKYCEENLQRISSGSSRIVYKIDDTKVLKLAKNEKGVAQNNTEITFSNDYMWDGITAELFESDEDGLWVEMELARKVTKQIWNNVIGVPLEIFEECCLFVYQLAHPQKHRYHIEKPERFEELYEIEFTSNILDLISNYNLVIGDFGKLSTYGIVNRDGEDEIVIIDYGLTQEVYDSYYK